jgi:uncharacterized protein (DUF1330 family)
MPTYMIFIREGAVFNAEEMANYQAANRAGPPNPDIKPLSVYGAIETLEGDAPDGIILLEFPNADAAKAWYYSDAYQAAIKHRKRAANYRAIMFEGL